MRLYLSQNRCSKMVLDCAWLPLLAKSRLQSCRGVAEMGKKENAKKLGHEHQDNFTVALPVCSYEYASPIHGDHTTVRDPPASDRTCLTYRR